MVKTANEEILDAVIRHQIYLLRYSGFVRNRITGLLNATEAELARRIRDTLRNTTEGLSTTADWKRLQALLAAVDAIRMEGWQEARTFLLDEMQTLAYKEPIFMDSIYTTPLPVNVTTVLPTTAFLKSIALSRPFEGRTLKEWADSMAKEDLRRIHSAVQAGMVAGEDHATIARRVVGTGNLMGADGATEMTRRQVQAVVRTAVQHVANTARNDFFQINADLFTQEQFVATLDSRTTPICKALDGKLFDIGRGPQAPLHFNCRSLRIAAINGTLLGERFEGEINGRDDLPRGTKGDYDKWARGRKRELIGPIPASQTYQTWLTGQSAAFQNDVLGETKGKLFRAGGLKLDKFVDLHTGREFTLHELAVKHAEGF